MNSNELRRILKNAAILEKPTHGWVYADEKITGFGGFFELDNIDDFFYEKIKPFFVFDCDIHKWAGIDVDDVLDNEMNNFYEGADDQIVDYDELVNFVEQWNSKQHLSEYLCNLGRIIILDREQFDSFLGNVD